jgi:anti-anti-sigma regulatory factor
MAISDAQRTEQIRRRVQREYLVVTAPVVLDSRTAPGFIEDLVEQVDDCDVVIDLRAVEVCDELALEVLERASQELVQTGATVTLSHPSAACDEALAGRDGRCTYTVRRPRSPRPIRRSLRGEL